MKRKSRPIVHWAIDFRSPRKGVLCRSTNFVAVTKARKNLTCVRCRKALETGDYV